MDNNILVPTGEYPNEVNNSNDIVYPFGQFEITIKLGYDKKFLGITEIKTRKDFYSFRDKNFISNIENFDDYYKEKG
jgi:hypothetical protein